MIILLALAVIIIFNNTSKQKLTMNRRIAAPFACLLLGLLVNAASAGEVLNGIPLQWIPRTTMAALGPVDISGPMATIHLHVEPFTDSRKQPELIAQNLERKEPRPVYTSTGVAGFVTQHLSDALRSAGLTLTDDQADFTVSGDIRTFFVTETDRYRGEIAIYFSVKDASGKEVFNAVINGAGDNFGRSYRPVNYYQTISDMILRVSHNLLTDPALHQALEQR